MQLEDLQRSIVAAIDHGPDHMIDTAFLGGRAAAQRGLSVHANTISHARLVAIEDSFPRCRESLGPSEFNALSRRFVELPEAAREPLASIGRHFPSFLSGESQGDAGTLAAFEWAWLEAYHASEGDALSLADLAGVTEDELLRKVVARHPASRLTAAVRDDALESEVPGLGEAQAILVTRPQAEVKLCPASAMMALQFNLLANPQPVCNLLACGDEIDGEDSLQALFAMLEAGSLVLT
ncbi:MAG: putative DNA-binding domain-containing protein [Novosphingobium sp.]|nr:putative DNA-binding domain-containing protein [Novosphingobium sp.]